MWRLLHCCDDLFHASVLGILYEFCTTENVRQKTSLFIGVQKITVWREVVQIRGVCLHVIENVLLIMRTNLHDGESLWIFTRFWGFLCSPGLGGSLGLSGAIGGYGGQGVRCYRYWRWSSAGERNTIVSIDEQSTGHLKLSLLALIPRMGSRKYRYLVQSRAGFRLDISMSYNLSPVTVIKRRRTKYYSFYIDPSTGHPKVVAIYTNPAQGVAKVCLFSTSRAGFRLDISMSQSLCGRLRI